MWPGQDVEEENVSTGNLTFEFPGCRVISTAHVVLYQIEHDRLVPLDVTHGAL